MAEMQTEERRNIMIGPDSGPEPPFPVRLSGRVIKGFGRGSKELGIPTANLPVEGLSVGGRKDLESGVYFGWAGLENTVPKHKSVADKAKLAGARVVGALESIGFGSTEEEEVDDGAHHHGGHVYPMVMSIGWNPFYKNTVRSVEVHIIHNFEYDFYGHQLNVIALGELRPEKDYVSKESLIEDIKIDIEVAGKSLARPAYAKYEKDEFLHKFAPAEESSKSQPAV